MVNTENFGAADLVEVCESRFSIHDSGPSMSDLHYCISDEVRVELPKC